MTSKNAGSLLEGKHIIIAGAGIASLAFLNSLQKLAPSFSNPPRITIYDRDTRKSTPKREGYSLSLNGADIDGGLIALRDMGLLDTILSHRLTGRDGKIGFHMFDKDWNSFMGFVPKAYDDLPFANIRIARRDLRTVLVEAAEKEYHINWGTSCTSAEKLNNGKIRVQLESSDGSEVTQEECDILIAADGASSKVRAAFRPGDTLQYAGVAMIGGIATFPDGNFPKPLDDSWGSLCSGEGVHCFVSLMDSKTLIWAVSQWETERRSKTIAPGQARELKEEAKKMGSMIASPFEKLVDATEDSTVFVLPAMDKPAFTHSEAGLGNVVFMGDSNHAVSPFAGNGANLALKDGWDLAVQLCKADEMADALIAYDKLSYPRAVKTLNTSHQRINMAHSQGIKWMFVKLFLRFGGWLMYMMGKSL